MPKWTYSDPAFYSPLQERLKIFYTYQSNAIEGNSLTDKENLYFLREDLSPNCRPFKDLLEARNHSDAVEYVLKLLDDSDDYEFDQHSMKSINSLLLNRIASNPCLNALNGRVLQKQLKSGQYKTSSNSVLKKDGSMHQYVDPIQVEPQMDELFMWINHNYNQGNEPLLHPILISAIAQYNFVRIHPFDDGNGRGSRMLGNMILHECGYPFAIIKIDQKWEYFAALESADNGDLESFILLIAVSKELDFMCKQLESFQTANVLYCKSRNYL